MQQRQFSPSNQMAEVRHKMTSDNDDNNDNRRL